MTMTAVDEHGAATTRSNTRRVHAVRDTGLLDTPPEETFDRLTRLAARLLDAPATFLSLVDERRDFYKSCYGFPEPLASCRQMTGATFCQFAITSRAPLVLDDVTTVPALCDIPAVQALGVRAYVGIPLVAENGEVIGSFCAVDIRPRHWNAFDLEVLTELAESALREIQLRAAVDRAARHEAAAHRSARTREEVLAVVAHDLRTPLGIIANGSYLLSHLDLPPQGVDAINSVRAASGLMATLITELLENAKFEAGHFTLHLQPVRGSTLVTDAVAMLAPIAARNGISLVPELNYGDGTVNADYERILRVFSNLVRNAIRTGSSGSVVRLKLEALGDELRFSVIDELSAMTAEQLLPIVDPAWRANDLAVPGAGLGLYIARVIVEAHGGTLRGTSTAGEGSRLAFTLPATGD